MTLPLGSVQARTAERSTVGRQSSLSRKTDAELAKEPLAGFGHAPASILEENKASLLKRIGQRNPKPTGQMVVARACCSKRWVIGAVGAPLRIARHHHNMSAARG